MPKALHQSSFRVRKQPLKPNKLNVGLSDVPLLILFLLLSTFLCREINFEEENHVYRFLEHEAFIPKCFNFRGATNDSEPKNAAMVCDRLTKIMFAILESYASEDRRRVDYVAISKSEEFRRYGRKSCCRKLLFWCNLYMQIFSR